MVRRWRWAYLWFKTRPTKHIPGSFNQSISCMKKKGTCINFFKLLKSNQWDSTENVVKNWLVKNQPYPHLQVWTPPQVSNSIYAKSLSKYRLVGGFASCRYVFWSDRLSAYDFECRLRYCKSRLFDVGQWTFIHES